MRTFWILIIFAITGCTNTTTGSASPEEPVDWHKGMPTSIPGQPEKATVPSITSGGEGDPCGESGEIPLDRFFGRIDDLVRGEVESVSFVVEDVFDLASGEQITFAECQNKERFPPVLKVVLKDAASLFQGDIGTIEFLIPTQAVRQMSAYPSFYYEGRWYPRDETPARIDGTVGWSRANIGIQAGQIIMIPLIETSTGRLHSWLYPIFEEVDGIIGGVPFLNIPCTDPPPLLAQSFVWEDLVEAYDISGVTPLAPYGFPVSLTPACNEPPPSTPPATESDAGMR